MLTAATGLQIQLQGALELDGGRRKPYLLQLGQNITKHQRRATQKTETPRCPFVRCSSLERIGKEFLLKTQRGSAVRVVCVYRTVSGEAVLVVVKMPPMDLLALALKTVRSKTRKVPSLVSRYLRRGRKKSYSKPSTSRCYGVALFHIFGAGEAS